MCVSFSCRFLDGSDANGRSPQGRKGRRIRGGAMSAGSQQIDISALTRGTCTLRALFLDPMTLPNLLEPPVLGAAGPVSLKADLRLHAGDVSWQQCLHTYYSYHPSMMPP